MRFLSFVKIAGGLAAMAVFLAACVVVDEGPRPWPPQSGGPVMCTQEYDPVCGERGRDRQTFGNACTARAEGYRVVHPGQCRRGGERPPQACTMDYRPVCAERGRDRQTFSNECMARGEGYRVVHDGQCRRGGGNSGGGSENFCTREYAPVCARRGNDVRTFGNSCTAEASDYRVIRRGPC